MIEINDLKFCNCICRNDAMNVNKWIINGKNDRHVFIIYTFGIFSVFSECWS